MTTKPLPPHGSLTRAMGNRRTRTPRCHCGPCRLAERRYSKRRLYLANTGTPLTVDATAAREHLQMLRDNGDALTGIAQAHGIPRRTLNRLIAGDLQRIHRRTSEAILAVQPGEATNLYRLVPSIGAIRRTRALLAAGHTLNAVCESANVRHSVASALLNGLTATIRYETDQRIRQGYQQLSSSRGDSARSLRRAERQGWRDPMWWEDYGHIDDPDFDPAAVEQELGRNEEAAVRRAEIEHLMSYGFDHETIAGRMDMHPTTVRNIMNELKAGKRRDRKQVAA